MKNMTVGDRIKFHRKRLGMTQGQLADRMGVSPQAVSKWEYNLSCPDISVLPELASVFGITVDELLGKEAAADIPAREAEIVEDEEEEEHGPPRYVFRWESKLGSVLFAFYILSVGVLLLCRNFIPVMDISWWTIVWTTALVFIGISGLIGHFSVFCLALAVVGAGALLNAYGILALSFSWNVLIPGALLLWGVSLLIDELCGNRPWRRRKSKKPTANSQHKIVHSYHCTDGELECELAFGSCWVPVASDMLKGGSIDACFGEFTVDFSGCQAVAPDCTISVDNSFGELTLLVPNRYEVKVQHDTAFAGDPKISGKPAAAVEGTIHLEADISFGTLNICYI